jgi:hypothetical protein
VLPHKKTGTTKLGSPLGRMRRSIQPYRAYYGTPTTTEGLVRGGQRGADVRPNFNWDPMPPISGKPIP